MVMGTLLEATCNYVYSLCQYFKLSWPLNIIYEHQLKHLSAETREKVHQLHDLLRCVLDIGNSLEIKRLVDSLPTDEDLLSVIDPADGLDILQHAVVKGMKSLVALLLHKKCCPDGYSCSPPLHLAAFIGNKSILELLLRAGASTARSVGMCYPNSHEPTGFQSFLFGFTQVPVYHCQSNKLTPVECAIEQNHVDCLELLLNYSKEKAKAFKMLIVNYLHFACREGSPDCISYFLNHYPEIINDCNAEGDTPLLTAVPWGRECVKVLVENGANVHLVSGKINETALHRLYRMSIDGLFSIYDTTMYLLTTGIEQDINAYTTLGETPLHMLVSHISYTGGNYVHTSERKVPRSHLQKNYQQQVLNSLKTLLAFNSDPAMLNIHGLTPLSRMLHIAVKSCNVDNPYQCVQTSIFTYLIRDYKNNYFSLGQAMELLLQHNADPNVQCHLGHSPLLLLLQCLLFDNVHELISQADDVLFAFEILLKSGANLNFVAGNQGTCATLIALVCQRYFNLDNALTNINDIEDRDDVVDGNDIDETRLDENRQLIKFEFAKLANTVLHLLLKYGLNANHRNKRTCPYPKGGSGNALIEFVRLTVLAKSSEDFRVIQMWLRTLLQWGADPDIEPYPSEPIICHSQSSIFLKKQGTQAMNHYIHGVKEREMTFTDSNAHELLLLFCNTMDHAVLYECLNSARSLARYHPVNVHRRNFISLVNYLSENPRSLKQIARVTVYKAMNRQIAAKVDGLPLPKLMKNYLFDIQ